MAEFTPEIVPLGSLAEVAAAAADLSQQEQAVYASLPIGPTTGIIARPPNE